MKVRVKKSATDAAPVADNTPTNRLTEITVKEVSVVDRAANKRKFLMVKEDTVKDAAGAAAAPKPPPPPGTPAQATPPTLQISPELKQKVLGILTTAQERIGIIQQVLESSTDTPGAAPPQELMDALAQLAQLIMPAAPQPQVPAPAPAAAGSAPAVPAPAAKDAGTEVTKAGRKLSAARISQLEAAHATIATLLADVKNETESDEKDADEADEGKKPAAKSETNTDVAEIKTTLAAVVDSVSKMTDIFEAQNKRIETLAKSRGSSQQLDVDRVPARKDADEVVSWPMDMAKEQRNVQ